MARIILFGRVGKMTRAGSTNDMNQDNMTRIPVLDQLVKYPWQMSK
jgi:hypothetical protein